jgi:hypothetical protein
MEQMGLFPETLAAPPPKAAKKKIFRPGISPTPINYYVI